MSEVALGGTAPREHVVEVAVAVENPGMRARIVTALEQTETVFVSGASDPGWIVKERLPPVTAVVIIAADIARAGGIESLGHLRGSLPSARLVAVVPSVSWANTQMRSAQASTGSSLKPTSPRRSPWRFAPSAWAR